jgi:hypothetical protein
VSRYQSIISPQYTDPAQQSITMPHSSFTLFDSVRVGDMTLANRVVMAPLTRNRAPDAIPTPLMARSTMPSEPALVC